MSLVVFFFFNNTATTEIYPLPLHAALPISPPPERPIPRAPPPRRSRSAVGASQSVRSEEHTSELQSQSNLVCRLLLEKKKKTTSNGSYAAIVQSLQLPYCTPSTRQDFHR